MAEEKIPVMVQLHDERLDGLFEGLLAVVGRTVTTEEAPLVVFADEGSKARHHVRYNGARVVWVVDVSSGDSRLVAETARDDHKIDYVLLLGTDPGVLEDAWTMLTEIFDSLK